MEKHTLETLRKVNPIYEREHRIHEADVEMVNDFIEKFTVRLLSNFPQPGELLVIEHPEKGVLHERALIEGWCPYNEKKLYVCTDPCIPHLKKDLKTDTSGGYWMSVEPDEFKILYFDTVRRFWTWGKWGHMKASGGIYFDLPVKTWKIVTEQFY